MKKIKKIVLIVFSLFLLFTISVANLRLEVLSVGDPNKVNLASLFSKSLAQTEEDDKTSGIWFIENHVLYFSNGNSGCTDAVGGNTYGLEQPKMCHIITGGTVHTTNTGSLTVGGTVTGEVSLTGASGSVSASSSGTIAVETGVSYQVRPGTMITCPPGSFPSCSWQDCM